MEINSMVYGLYPRSEKIRRGISKWERKMMSEKDIAELIDEESHLFYRFCESKGIRYYSDPLFNWYDVLRPLSLSIEGVSLGPLTRYKETNTFYRMPDVKFIGDLNKIDEFLPVKDNPPLPLFHPGESGYVFFLPGIESFIMMSRVRSDINEIRKKMITIYNKIVDVYTIKSLILYELFPVEDFSLYDDINGSVDLFLVTTGKIEDRMFSRNRRKFFSIISEDPYKVSKFCKVPGIKIVDAFNTKMESRTVDLLKKYKDDFGEIIATSNEYFDFLPRVIADKKLEVMGGWGK